MTTHQPNPPPTPTPATSPGTTLPTLDYRSSPGPHPHAVRQAWPLTFIFWTGAIFAGFLILFFHALITTTTAGEFSATRLLVALGQSTLVGSFSTCMFALAINGKIFRSRRRLIRRPRSVAFALGASVPLIMGICVFLATILNWRPLEFVVLLALFGLATIYPMLSAQWLGDRVE